MREDCRLTATLLDWRGRTDSNPGPRRGDAGSLSLEGGEQGPDVAYGEGPGGVPVPGVPLQEGVVIGVQRSLVAHTIQGPHHLQHIHIPVVKHHLIVASILREGTPDVPEVDMEYPGAEPLDLLMDIDAGLEAGPGAEEDATVNAGDGVEEALDLLGGGEPGEETLGVGDRRIVGVDREADPRVLEGGDDLLVDVDEALVVGLGREGVGEVMGVRGVQIPFCEFLPHPGELEGAHDVSPGLHLIDPPGDASRAAAGAVGIDLDDGDIVGAQDPDQIAENLYLPVPLRPPKESLPDLWEPERGDLEPRHPGHGLQVVVAEVRVSRDEVGVVDVDAFDADLPDELQLLEGEVR